MRSPSHEQFAGGGSHHGGAQRAGAARGVRGERTTSGGLHQLGVT